MRIVKAKLNEYLVVGRKGRLQDLGTAVTTVLLPWAEYVTIPSDKQDVSFEMTQDSVDGVPLRIKGLVIYRVIDPVAVARRFDFSAGRGHEAIQGLLAKICQGELRDAVARMTMRECIENRRTTLSGILASALETVVRGTGGAGDADDAWGIDLEVAQVAQVYIQDEDLRQKLEAEITEKITAKAEQSRIQARADVECTSLASERRVRQDELASERERTEIEREKAELAGALERARIEVKAPIRLLALDKERERLDKELAVRRVAHEVKTLEVEDGMLLERAQSELRRETLPLEQVPDVARALSGIFDGAQLSVYGADAAAIAGVAPLVDFVVDRLQGAGVLGSQRCPGQPERAGGEGVREEG